MFESTNSKRIIMNNPSPVTLCLLNLLNKRSRFIYCFASQQSLISTSMRAFNTLTRVIRCEGYFSFSLNWTSGNWLRKVATNISCMGNLLILIPCLDLDNSTVLRISSHPQNEVEGPTSTFFRWMRLGMELDVNEWSFLMYAHF